jgi:hypothetical protein
MLTELSQVIPCSSPNCVFLLNKKNYLEIRIIRNFQVGTVEAAYYDHFWSASDRLTF